MSNAKRVILAIAAAAVFMTVAAGAFAAVGATYTDYPYGIQLTGGSSYTSDLGTKYSTWLSKFVVASGSNGSRVKAPENPHFGRTVSEGQAYGMVIAVYMNDKTTFDALLKYKLWLCSMDGNSQLMPWATNNDGTAIADGGSATDADTDMAFALIQAYRRWGGSPSGITGALTYQQYANGMLSAIMAGDIAGDNSLKPGDSWDDYEYPSYYSEAFYREFNTYQGNTAWNNLISTCNTHLSANRNTSNGLTSETANHTGTRRDDSYGYNACRVPMRYAIDYIWNGNTFADGQIDYQAAFFANISADQVGDGYSVSSGGKTSSNNNAAFIGPAGCSFMGGTNSAKLTEYYTRTAQQFTNHCNNNEYYNATLGLWTMLVMSGHFPKTFSSVTPTYTWTPGGATATPVPGTCLFDDFEDQNAENGYGGFWYTYASGGGTISPMSPDTMTPVAGGAVSTGYSQHFTGTVGIEGTTYPAIGTGSQLNATAGAPSYTVTNISTCTGVRFYVKGDAKSYYIKIPYVNASGASLTGYNDYKYTFTAPTTWSQVDAAFSTFAQASGWGTSAVLATVLANAREFQWQTNFYATAGTTTASFYIDDIYIYGCSSCPATATPTFTNTPPPGSTDTYTPTPTNTVPTATFTNTPNQGCLLDNMEDQNAENGYGGFWYTYASGGGTISPMSPDTMTPVAGGANSSLYAQHFTGTVGIEGTTYPAIGTGTQLNATSGAPAYTITDISSCTGVKFYVKGDGKSYYIKVPYVNASGASLTGYNDYKYTFSAPTTWSQVDAPFVLFGQASGWGTSAVLATVLANAREFQWQTNFYATAGTTTAELYLDDIYIYGCTSCPATATPTVGSPTSTFTYTRTPTATNTVPAGSTNTFTPTPTNTVASPTATIDPLQGCLFDNLEDENSENAYGGFWYTYASGDGATISPMSPDTMTPVAGGANGTLYAQHFTGTVGIEGTTYPSIGTGSQLNATAGAPAYTITDISSCTGIKFYVKGDNKSYYIKIPYANASGASLTGYNDYKYTFTAPAAWSQVDAPFALFSQASGWGTSAVLSTVLANAKEFQWQTNFYATAGTTTAELYLDEIYVYGCSSCPVVATPTSVVPTSTFTPTIPGPTSTFTPTRTPTNTPPVGATNTFTPTPTNTVSGVCLMDDFEDMDNANNYGGYWYTYASGNGTSIVPASGVDMIPTAAGYNSLYSQGFTGTVGTEAPDYPSIGMGSQLNPNAGDPTFQETDISSCTGIRFYVKGDGKSYYVKIPYSDNTGASLTGYNDYKYIFTAPATWSQVDAPFVLFGQATGWGTTFPLATVLQHAKELQWQDNFYAAAGTDTAEIYVDDVVIYGCSSCPTPPPTDTPTIDVPTNTFTETPTVPAGATNTFTPTPTNTLGLQPTNTVPAGMCLFDNMDDNDNGNAYGGFWYTYTGGTPSTVSPASGQTLSPTAGGANSTLLGMRITGTVGIAGTTYPCVGMGSQFTATSGAPTFTELDISSCQGMRFYTKGNNKQYLVKIAYTDNAGATLTEYNDYRFGFTAPSTWTEVVIPFTSMTQASGWGISAVLSTVLQNAKEIQWQSDFYATAGTTDVDLSIDEVFLYGCASCPGTTPVATATFTQTLAVTSTFTPTPSPTGTSTNTFTNTPTNTNTPTPTATVTSGTGPSLTASIIAPSTGTVGQQITVVMDVYNSGDTNLTATTFTMVPSDPAMVTLFSGPTPMMGAVPVGGHTYFTWVYDVTSSTNDITFTGTVTSAGPVVNGIAPASSLVDLRAIATATFTQTLTFTPTATPTETATTWSATNTFTPTVTPIMPTATFTPTWPVLEIITPTPAGTPKGIISNNPNPTPGVPVDRVISVYVTKQVTKIEVKLYTKAGRLVRVFTDSNTHEGMVSLTLRASFFEGLAKGTYYYVITASGASTTARSSVEKLLVQ